jgi:hypothetical protein
MSDYYNPPPRWTDARWVWAAIVAVCAVALAGNLAVWLLLRDPDSGSSSSSGDLQQGPANAGWTGGHHSTSTVTPDQGPAVEAAVADCRSRWQQQREPLKAAQSSLQQWRVHIQAMNQLVAGQISLSQASAFWNQTRKGAMHRITRFEQAINSYEGAAPECAPQALQTPDPTSSLEAADDCVLAAVAGDRVLAAAKTAITTWQQHVHHMEMLRNGQMTAAQATQMWQMSWQAGKVELVECGRANMHALYLRCA